MRDALKRIGGIPDAPVEPILPAVSPFFYRNKLEYSFTQTPSGPALGFHKGRPLGRGAGDRRVLVTTKLGNAVRNAVHDWAREENLEDLVPTRPSTPAISATSSTREGRNTGQMLRRARRPRRGEVQAGLPRRGSAPLPEVNSDPLGDERPAVRGDGAPSTLLWGDDAIEEELLGRRFRVRPNAFLRDEHGDGRAGLHARDRVRGADGRRDGLRPLLRHGHDRALAGEAARSRCGASTSRRSRSRARSRISS